MDFFQPILRMGQAVNTDKALDIDWAALSSRAARSLSYRARPGHRRQAAVAPGRSDLPRSFGYIAGATKPSGLFTPTERDELNLIWTRLDPWPDSAGGLARLRRRFITATLSNAGMAAVIAVVKHAGLPFDAILTAELARSYKPAPAVYQLAVDYLGFRPHEILMVACHKYDLKAARGFGMRTAFVARPLEFGPAATPDTTAETWFDLYLDSFVALADALGA